MVATYSNAAQISHTSGAGGQVAALARFSIKRWKESMVQEATPWLDLIGAAEVEGQPEGTLNWGWDDPLPLNDTAGIQDSGGINNSATAITVTDADMYMVGYGLRIENERLRVTAINTTTNVLTVVRGVAGSTAATHAEDTPITIYTQSVIQNQDTPLAPVVHGEYDSNYWQKLDQGLQFDYMADVIHNWQSLSSGQKRRFQAEVYKKLRKEAPKLVEGTLIDGLRAAGSITTPSLMGGVYQPEFIYTRVDLGGAPLTEYNLMNVMQTGWSLVGEAAMGKTAIMPPFAARALSSMYNGARRITGGETTVKNYVNRVATQFGEVRFVPHYNLDDTKHGVLICRPEKYQLVACGPEGNWHTADLPENGFYKRGAVRAVLSLRAPDPQERMLITNYSIDEADYPRFA